MKSIMKYTALTASMVIALTLVITAQAQTATECTDTHTDCQKTKTESVKSDVSKKTTTGMFTGIDRDTFIADSSSIGKTPMPKAAYGPTPTPTPDDQTAAPAKPQSNGSNPAELITRIEMKYQFQNFGSGYLHSIPIIRGDYAFTKAVSVRMDLPILSFDPKASGAKTETGIGDIVTSMTFVKMFSKKFVGAFVPRIDFPTASYASLGSGKYSFKPLIAGVTPLGKGLGLVGVLEYRVSFAGKANRADIHELSIKSILLKSFTSGSMKGFYINPKAEVIVDFETNNRTTVQAGAEFGKAINKNLVMFAVPTVHVAGTKKESFKLEIGFRYLFR